ncbi:hypothetical protein [Microbacterium album]|uniref:Uncharacterized protein n=1 Tax=Microbacterium album TaxID=2053191 RepID=A0A917ICS6_9MICO|nr:hypothetical protein [Microbacterium album]GGH34279.1 hypothetical protein GCM10010921_01860 [Microbacterium album]
MDAQLVAALGSSTVLGIVITKVFDWVRDARAGHLQRRRAEVDRAITERDKALVALEASECAEEDAARRVRIVEESLAIHRRVIIDAPCLGPEALPTYPSRKD